MRLGIPYGLDGVGMKNEELAKKFVEHPKWEWLDGALDRYGRRYVCPFFIDDGRSYEADGTESPDLEDPATLRLILELIRRDEGWACASIVRRWSGEFDIVSSHPASRYFRAETEAEALWAAFKELTQ